MYGVDARALRSLRQAVLLGPYRDRLESQGGGRSARRDRGRRSGETEKEADDARQDLRSLRSKGT